MKTEADKLFTKSTLFLILIGIAINFVCARIALYYDLPVYLDAIGTILVAALGGYLPGIIVGFATNTVNSFADMVTMYYGLLSIIISIAASYLAERGVFKKLWKTLLSTFLFAFLGGFLGTLITWMLYGMNFGYGISSKYAHFLYEYCHFSKFASLAIPDYVIDFIDKFIAVLIVYLVIKVLPKSIIDKMPLGYVYLKGPKLKPKGIEKKPGIFSLQTKVTILLMVALGILGSATIIVGFNFYQKSADENNMNYCYSALSLVYRSVDADQVDEYLDTGGQTDSYITTEKELYAIKKSFPSIEYLYVYKIKEDGCHVVFDLDTKETEASDVGTVIPFDKSFLPQKEELLQGKEIEPIISNDSYGWLKSVYKPLYNSDGECTAYAAVDISMRDIMMKRYEFTIRMITIIMGIAIFLAAIAIWYGRKQIVNPLKKITDVSGKFTYDSEGERNKDLQNLKSLNIKTGDEIEELYHSVSNSFEEVMHYIGVIKDKNSEISKLQDNIILSFAEMVESRDSNTGNHVKRTAAIVEALGREMFKRGCFPEILTETYLEDMIKAAPLHDIGKIKISDIILNKPGKLNREEFEQIKTHTTAGGDILENALTGIEESEYLTIAIDMARCHHEKWDGSGYPTGLAGEEIPLCARVMAIADVFDALTSKRSYKEAFSFEEAMGIIKHDAGSHFDAQLVAVFESIESTIRELTEEEPNSEGTKTEEEIDTEK